MSQPSRISVVIHTLNEERNIHDCLESVKWADEIVIVDMHSDDRTTEICHEYTDRIFLHERMGYADPARNFGLAQATGDWILSVDADERVPPKLATTIREFVDSPQSLDIVGVRLPMKNIFFGRWWARYGAWYPAHHMRLYRRGKVRYSGKVHIEAEVDGNILSFPPDPEASLIHCGYNTISHFIASMDRYTTIEARQRLEAGERFEWYYLIKRPLGEFWWRFIRNQQFRDGLHGLILCQLMMMYVLVLAIKQWELGQRGEQSL